MNTLRILIFSLICAFGVGKVCADTVLMFSADWCKYCQLAKRDMLDRKDEVADWSVDVVDTNASPEMVQEYKVRTLPTFIYLNDAGEELDRQVGYKGYRHLRRWVEKNKR